MDINAIIKVLLGNQKSTWMETTRIILKLSNNILQDPFNLKYRSLKKANSNINSNIIKVRGGIECLKYMGFEENETAFVLDLNAPLENIEKVYEKFSNIQDSSNEINLSSLSENENEVKDAELSSSSSDNESTISEGGDDDCGPVVLLPNSPGENCDACLKKVTHGHLPQNIPQVAIPTFTNIFANEFFRSMQMTFNMALVYADKNLIERAKLIIPRERLERKAVEKLRLLQSQLKEGQSEDPNISLQDLLVIELLDWFKNDFFTWVDSPRCTFCGNKTVFSHMSTDNKWCVHTKRVEIHQCTNCNLHTPFPRYNDPNILLITRQGRCGEWANTFTLLCYAMGWDARIVYDQTDHVWTEVFSLASKRWVHCDPCENAFDTPLMYENGWGKKLTYCIGYSIEEVQDVTWRYSSKHKEVLSRRNQCGEQELISAMLQLRQSRLSIIRPSRQEYLVKRVLGELIELMTEKKPTEKDSQGRSSGAIDWRISRGEIQESKSYTWILQKVDSDLGDIEIQYSSALNQYQYVTIGKKAKTVLPNWQDGVFYANNIFRKEEKDWKKTYLARTEGSQNGSISWKFVLDNPNKVIDIIDIKLQFDVFEDGKVEIEVKGDTSSITFPPETFTCSTSAFSGSKTITVIANLSFGKGNHFWQHAQLFRDTLNSKSYPFSILFKFKSK